MKAFTPFPANNPSNIADMTQIADAIRIAEIIDIDVQEPPNVRVDAAARIQSSIAGPVMMRNTLPPLASNDLLGAPSSDAGQSFGGGGGDGRSEVRTAGLYFFRITRAMIAVTLTPKSTGTSWTPTPIKI